MTQWTEMFLKTSRHFSISIINHRNNIKTRTRVKPQQDDVHASRVKQEKKGKRLRKNKNPFISRNIFLLTSIKTYETKCLIVRQNKQNATTNKNKQYTSIWDVLVKANVFRLETVCGQNKFIIGTKSAYLCRKKNENNSWKETFHLK